MSGGSRPSRGGAVYPLLLDLHMSADDNGEDAPWEDWDEGHELAKHRLDTAREAAKVQRMEAQEKTRRRRERALRQQQEAQRIAEVERDAAEEEEDEMIGHVSKKRESVNIILKSATLSELLLHDACVAAEQEEHDSGGEFPKKSPGDSNHFNSMLNEGDSDHLLVRRTSSHAQREQQKGHHPLKLPREERVTSVKKQGSVKSKQPKLAKLWLARRREFEDLARDERDAFRKAFLASGAEMLDVRGLRNALREFGLVARSPLEKSDVQDLCQELCIMGKVDFYTFCFESVPRTRQVLRQCFARVWPGS